MEKNFKENKIIIMTAIIFAIATVFLISKNTYSAESTVNEESLGQIKIECDSNKLLPSGNMNCTIKAENFTKQVSSFSAKLKLDNNLSLESIEKDSSWEGSGEGGVIDLYTDKNKTGNFDFITFNVMANDIKTGINSIISLQNIVISDENFDEYNLSNVSTTIRIQSTINTLNNLVVSGVDFTFDPATTTYNLTTDLGETTISAVATNQNATIVGDVGTKKINYGDNTYTIKVTSESGSTTTYTIKITRPEWLNFTSDVLVDDEEMILEFTTTNLDIAKLSSKIDTTGSVTITDSEGNNAITDYIGTGYKISVELSTKTYEYTISIFGDTTGDGLITVADVSKLFQHYRKTKPMDEVEDKIYILSGDVKEDGQIKLTDIAKLFQYVQGKISSLK